MKKKIMTTSVILIIVIYIVFAFVVIPYCIENPVPEYDYNAILYNNPYKNTKEYVIAMVKYEVPTQNDIFDRLVEAGIASEEDYKGTFIYIGNRYGDAGIIGHFLIIHFVYNGDEMTWDLYDPDSDTPFEFSMSDETEEEFMEILKEEFLLYKTRKKEAIDVNKDGEIDELDKLICALFTCGLPLQGVYFAL